MRQPCAFQTKVSESSEATCYFREIFWAPGRDLLLKDQENERFRKLLGRDSGSPVLAVARLAWSFDKACFGRIAVISAIM